jgi:hypothetical protein
MAGPRAARTHPYGVALRAINLAVGQVVELGLFVCREFEPRRRAGSDDEGFSSKESDGAPWTMNMGTGSASSRSPVRDRPLHQLPQLIQSRR